MRTYSLVAAAALALSLASIASAQTTSTHHKKIFGYQDAETGVFHPATAVEPDTTVPPHTGTIEVTITTTLKTTVPAGGHVYCGTSIDATSESINLTTDAFSLSDWEEESYSLATVTGSTATCTVTTPYSWNLPTATPPTVTNSISGTYTVAIVPATTTTVVEYTVFDRLSSAPIPGLTAIPANSTTPTKYTVTATI